MNVSSEVRRTLVKSPPELWAELSDAESLARHLGESGEIRITRAEPERELTWEADGASGSVRLAPAGFGTKVTLSLTRDLPEPRRAVEPEPDVPLEQEPLVEMSPEPEPVAGEPEPVAGEPEPVAGEPEPVAGKPEPEPPEQRRSFFTWLFRRRRIEQAIATEAAEPEPVPEPVVAAEPEPEANPDPVVAFEPEPEAETPIVDLTGDLAAVETQMAEQDAELLRTLLDRLGAAHHRPFSRG